MPVSAVEQSERPAEEQQPSEHFDVVIVGAGLSGIGCAAHLRREQPGKSYVLLEARGATGGTWDLFRYPGIRSDSDLHTYAYEFKPWRDQKAIADGPAILRYIRETAREYDVERHIRLGHKVLSASWCSERALWTVQALRAAGDGDGAGREIGDDEQLVTFTCSWLFSAGGYYRYDAPYTPSFPGSERFQGTIVHPQLWPEQLDYAGKRVVVVGSGATAVTLVPAMTDRAEHVTMLQRSPGYVVSVPERDPIANALMRWLSPERAYALTRRKNIWLQRNLYRLSQSRPQLVRRLLRAGVKRQLPPGYPVDVDFNPRYNPWDQRLCVVPDSDLFKAIADGRASIVTDRIDTFTERGIRLASGRELEADIVVSATGMNLLAFGGVQMSVDGEPVKLPEKLAFKAMLLSDVPNFAFAVGYTNSSWTLKMDLVCEYLSRLMAYMDERGYDTCVAHCREQDMPTRPLLDFAAGYVQRSMHEFPRQGTRFPWSLAMSYAQDVKNLREGRIEDPELHFSHSARAADEERQPATVLAA